MGVGALVVSNNTDQVVRLLVVGDSKNEKDLIHYPLHPERNKLIGNRCWTEVSPESSVIMTDYQML
jgi:uncharacterized cupin superfamily protein